MPFDYDSFTANPLTHIGMALMTNANPSEALQQGVASGAAAKKQFDQERGKKALAEYVKAKGGNLSDDDWRQVLSTEIENGGDGSFTLNVRKAFAPEMPGIYKDMVALGVDPETAKQKAIDYLDLKSRGGLVPQIGAKIPPGYRPAAQGDGVEPIPGGPADKPPEPPKPTTFEEEMAKGDAKAVAGAYEKRKMLESLKGSLAGVSDKVSGTSDMLLGPVAGRISPNLPFVGERVQSLESATNEIALRAKSLLDMPSNNFSDADRNFLVAIAGGVRMDKPALANVVARLGDLTARELKYNNDLISYAEKNGGLKGFSSSTAIRLKNPQTGKIVEVDSEADAKEAMGEGWVRQ